MPVSVSHDAGSRHAAPGAGPTKYLVINAFSSRNAGDAAIVLATASVLRVIGAAEVVNSTRYYQQDGDFYGRHDIRVVPPVVAFAPRTGGGREAARVVSLAFGTAAAFFVVAVHRRKPSIARRIARALRLRGLQELLAADRVIVCGGGYLYSAGRINMTLVHIVVSTKLAQVAGKRPIMMPQSVGPLPRRLDRALVAWGFAKISPIVVRDDLALREAQGLFATRLTDIQVCPDIVFAGAAAPAMSTSAGGDRRAVGIVAMDWTWARDVPRRAALDTYVRKLAELSLALAGRGLAVRLYGHSRIPEMGQDDLAVARRVVELAGAGDAVKLDPLGITGDVTDLRQCFRGLSVVVGTRLHSCILALSEGTPAIGLGYQPKTAGTFHLLGMDAYCFDVDGFDVGEVESAAATLGERGAAQREIVVARVEAARRQIFRLYADVA